MSKGEGRRKAGVGGNEALFMWCALNRPELDPVLQRCWGASSHG